MASLETAYEQVAILAEDFKNNEKYYIQPDYSEAQARKDFIDKFFIALGWDVKIQPSAFASFGCDFAGMTVRDSPQKR